MLLMNPSSLDPHSEQFLCQLSPFLWLKRTGALVTRCPLPGCFNVAVSKAFVMIVVT